MDPFQVGDDSPDSLFKKRKSNLATSVRCFWCRKNADETVNRELLLPHLLIEYPMERIPCCIKHKRRVERHGDPNKRKKFPIRRFGK